MHLSDVVATWLSSQESDYEVAKFGTGEIGGYVRHKGKLWGASGHSITHIYDQYVILWGTSDYGIRISAYQHDLFPSLSKHIEHHRAIWKEMQKEARTTTYNAWVKNVRNPSWLRRILNILTG